MALTIGMALARNLSPMTPRHAPAAAWVLLDFHTATSSRVPVVILVREH